VKTDMILSAGTHKGCVVDERVVLESEVVRTRDGLSSASARGE
jgi:hypothetical protein